jgi:membrane-bound acyltransferase YfiQ involved in biofilm formation
MILLGLVFALLGYWGGVVSPTMAFYFLAGVVIRHSGVSILQVFRPSWLALAAFVWLAMYPVNLQSSAPGGILMAYLFVSFALAAYPLVGLVLRRPLLFVGSNTLSLLLFSPIFTILCKSLVSPLSFEPTGMLFLVVSLIICIAGSLMITWLMDKLHVSSLFFGKPHALISY